MLQLAHSQITEPARYHGEQATFTPIADPASVGNGVHIHMSFRDQDGKPATYDPDGPWAWRRLLLPLPLASCVISIASSPSPRPR